MITWSERQCSRSSDCQKKEMGLNSISRDRPLACGLDLDKIANEDARGRDTVRTSAAYPTETLVGCEKVV